MNVKKPKIAILLAAPDGNFIRTDKRYAESVIRAGGVPFHITPDGIEKQMDALYPDGLILPGGNFPTPAEHYIDKSAYADLPPQPERVKAYFSMIEWSRRNSACLLGICAGMQLLAVSLGGKLTSGISGHRGTDEDRHAVDILPGSLLAEVLGDGAFSTNTKHSEAIAEAAGGDFIISGRAEDGVIEAIEPRKPWGDFVLGVQWHPEQLSTDIQKEQKIFDAFVEASAARH